MGFWHRNLDDTWVAAWFRVLAEATDQGAL